MFFDTKVFLINSHQAKFLLQIQITKPGDKWYENIISYEAKGAHCQKDLFIVSILWSDLEYSTFPLSQFLWHHWPEYLFSISITGLDEAEAFGDIELMAEFSLLSVVQNLQQGKMGPDLLETLEVEQIKLKNFYINGE